MPDKDRQIENQSTLASKRIVLLGGSSGIGLAVAQQVVVQGAHAVIASSNQERLQKAADSLGGDAEGRRLDLSDESSIELFFQELGAFDHLVYTAGDTLQLDELAAMDLKKARGAFELRFWSAVAAANSYNLPASKTHKPARSQRALPRGQPGVFSAHSRYSGRHRVDSNRCQFDRQCACERDDRPAAAGGDHPSFARAQARYARRQDN
jgi:NAD(P)-dependent dehydrogenase (short-subunit alcohol dehydrogenase family)